MEAFRALESRRAALEAEIAAILESLGPLGAHGPLVDAEGFPRADVDVHAVRQSRHQLARLQNDHVAVMH